MTLKNAAKLMLVVELHKTILRTEEDRAEAKTTILNALALAGITDDDVYEWYMA